MVEGLAELAGEVIGWTVEFVADLFGTNNRDDDGDPTPPYPETLYEERPLPPADTQDLNR